MNNKKSSFFQEEVSVAQLLGLLTATVAWLQRSWWVWMIAAVCGMALGWLAAQWKPAVYQAKMVLAAEEEKSSGYEGLAAQFGFDLGNSGSTLFQGDGLLRLFTSQKLIDSALLRTKTKEDIVLADALFQHTKHAHKSVFEGFSFEEANAHKSVYDSALQLLRKEVIGKALTVDKPDKKVAILEISTRHRDQYLAALLVESVVKEVADFYVITSTLKSRQNLQILQAEYDSVQRILNQQLYRSANESDLAINPTRKSLLVASNKSMIEVEITAKVLGELTKNLKLAEINLRKQTPLIQVIDPVSFPLEKIGWKLWKFLMAGAAVGMVFAAWLTRKRWHV